MLILEKILNIKEAFDEMMRLRASTGYATNTYRYTITEFINFCISKEGVNCVISKELIDQWLGQRKYSPNSRAVFISLLREFSKYLHFVGRNDYTPDDDYSTNRIRYNPYIFTDAELAALFYAIDTYKGKTCGKRLFPELILPVYSRLLYCCGMRPQEPPLLLCDDVNLNTGEIYIKKSKRNKDRHIIMSNDMLSLCKSYDRLAGIRTWFFERPDGKHYEAQWFRELFVAILSEANVSWRGNPRPYDLRHSFASRNITNWIESGKDVMELMPYLSAYMGHSELKSTYYYVHLVPEKLRQSTKISLDIYQSIYE